MEKFDSYYSESIEENLQLKKNQNGSESELSVNIDQKKFKNFQSKDEEPEEKETEFSTLIKDAVGL